MSAKAEALRALDHVNRLLAGDLTPMERAQAVATLIYARENVEAIQETMRPRRVKPAAEEEHHG